MRTTVVEEERQPRGGEITRALWYWHEGRQDLDGVMPLVYESLRRKARQYLDGEAACRTLQPTALVNEAFLRLVECGHVRFESRTHFFCFAGRLMRRVLVEHARARLSHRRGEGMVPLSLEGLEDIIGATGSDLFMLIALDRALSHLERHDPRRSRIVEMRYFAGLNIEEIALILEVTPRTVRREWRTARLWLAREMGAQGVGA